jgi:hypothetical protein
LLSSFGFKADERTGASDSGSGYNEREAESYYKNGNRPRVIASPDYSSLLSDKEKDDFVGAKNFFMYVSPLNTTKM